MASSIFDMQEKNSAPKRAPSIHQQRCIMNEPDLTPERIRTSCKLLRGELSAVQSYEMAIKRHPALAAALDLARISNDHRRSARLLTSMVREMGGDPAIGAGAWGVFANSIQTPTTFLGAASTVASLKQGEEQGRNDYEDALDDETTSESFKALIRSDLLTSIEDHITCLDTLLNEVA
jgi:hypothetical protein